MFARPSAMADWYYTTNKQQRGPVSLEELRRLAAKGLLLPTDLVWNDRMSDWARAGSQRGLFAEEEGAAAVNPEAPLAARVVEVDDEDRPLRSSRSRAYQRADDADDDHEDRRPRRARRTEGGMPVGIKVGLIVGGVVLIFIVAAVGLYFLLRPARPTEIAAGVGNFNGFLRLNDMRDPVRGTPCRIYNVRMIQGRTYVIDLRSGQFDSFLRLEDSAFRQLAQDDDGGGNLDARIIFRCPRTDTYRVIATNLGGGQGAYTLSIREN